jgi:hypothetical protein
MLMRMEDSDVKNYRLSIRIVATLPVTSAAMQCLCDAVLPPPEAKGS